MKTINDLVDELNRLFDDSEFYIERRDAYDVMDGYVIYMKNHVVIDIVSELIEIDEKDNRWCAGREFGSASEDIQKTIMDFIYTTDSNHWFDEPEKKYNIIIGENKREKLKTAYHKLSNGTYIGDAVEEDDLKTDRYIFTESEIEQLKSTLPENMAKIVDLGKVEVKDED